MVSCGGTKSARERGLTILLRRFSCCCCLVLATQARGAAFIAPISLRSRRQIVHGVRTLSPQRLYRSGESPIFVSGPFYHVADATNEDRDRHTRRELAPCAVASVLSAAEAVKPVSADLSFSRRMFSTMFSLILGYIWTMLRKTMGWMSPSPLEVQLVLRLAFSAVVGILIGLERRTSHRPAGVRTMSLVAMGACTFTLVSRHGFSKADEARVAASVASGVGFIGAGVITTASKDKRRPKKNAHDVEGDVRGLTTASAIWITSGLGMACGAGLFFTAAVGAVMTVAILRLATVQNTIAERVKKLKGYMKPKVVAPERKGRGVVQAVGHTVPSLAREHGQVQDILRRVEELEKAEKAADDGMVPHWRQRDVMSAPWEFGGRQEWEQSGYLPQARSRGHPGAGAVNDDAFEDDDPLSGRATHRHASPREVKVNHAVGHLQPDPGQTGTISREDSAGRVWVRSRVLPHGSSRARRVDSLGLELQLKPRSERAGPRTCFTGSVGAAPPLNGDRGHAQHDVGFAEVDMETPRNTDSASIDAEEFPVSGLEEEHMERDYSKQARALGHPEERGEPVQEHAADEDMEHDGAAHRQEGFEIPEVSELLPVSPPVIYPYRGTATDNFDIADTPNPRRDSGVFAELQDEDLEGGGARKAQGMCEVLRDA